MAAQIFNRAFTFSVLVLGRRLQHTGPVASCSLELRANIVNAHFDDVGCYSVLGRPLITTDISHNHGPVVSDAHLGTMTVSNANPLRKAERGGEPGNRFAHVRIHKDWDDGGWRYGSVCLHGTFFSTFICRRIKYPLPLR